MIGHKGRVAQRGTGTLAAFLLLAFFAVAAANASAATAPELFSQFPEAKLKGSGANQLSIARPGNLAIEPVGHRVYVTDNGNHRVSVFSAWGEFLESWGWGVASGTPALESCGPKATPPTITCGPGLAGSGAGQLKEPNGVTIDADGSVYVYEFRNARVQKFTADGDFIFALGGEVNKTTGENLCTAASGDTCGVGIIGIGAGAFNPEVSTETQQAIISTAADGTLYVGDPGRIEKFDSDGNFLGELPAPEAKLIGGLAVDPSSGDLYLFMEKAATEFSDLPIYRLNSTTGAVLDVLQVEPPAVGGLEGMSVDNDGNVYVIYAPQNENEFFQERARVVVFDDSGEVLFSPLDGFAAALPAVGGGFPNKLMSLANNAVGDLYVLEMSTDTTEAFVNIYGPPPLAIEPPPTVPPSINETFATDVGVKDATVKARINPRYWSDTTYYVEYGTEDCELGGCAKRPTPPGSSLTSKVVNASLSTAGVALTGLQANTTYHYRFASDSGGGSAKGPDRTFTTGSLPAAQPACPDNQAFRPGPGAFLPDCRAYEMVSPVDKNGADISALFNISNDRARLDQSTAGGDRISYSAYRAFGDAVSAPFISQYVAGRTEGVGWSNTAIAPPRVGASLFKVSQLDIQYSAFTPDLCQGWLLQDTENSLAPGSIIGAPDLYRRDLCSSGGYTTVGPFVMPSGLAQIEEFRMELQGFSDDGSKSFFSARGKLTPNASSVEQLYESSNGSLQLVCILPNGTAVKTTCTAGTARGNHAYRGATLTNAISDDGSRVYWTPSAFGTGNLYVRVAGTETLLVKAGGVQFWAATPDGSAAIYTVGGELFRFDLATKTSTLIAKGVSGVMGASEDLSRIYLVSSESLDAGATGGKPNLYLFEDGEPGSFTFIATLASLDVAGGVPGPVDPVPIYHSSRVTPDGGAAAFISRGQPTGFDNTDAVSGEPNTEVYLYRAGRDLICVSCDPGGARPGGRDMKGVENLQTSLWVSGRIPPASTQLYAPRVLSDDGTRLFFETFEALVNRDTNAMQDVYQWEATGSGNCAEAAPGFRAALGGCVNLISTGESPQDSALVDSSADGRDVFFKTSSSLLPQDPGLVDIYDARAGGGFTLQEPPPPGCEGEACQNPPPSPNDPTPGSASFQGPGNPPSPKPKTCPKGKHKVKKNGTVRCVKNKKKGQKQKQGKSGRAVR